MTDYRVNVKRMKYKNRVYTHGELIELSGARNDEKLLDLGYIVPADSYKGKKVPAKSKPTTKKKTGKVKNG